MTMALVRTYRRLEKRCARCRAPWTDQHLCDDRVRHPKTTSFLSSMRKALECAGGVPERLFCGVLDPAWGPPDFQSLSVPEVELILTAAQAAIAYQSLPASEREVVQAILVHAGFQVDLGELDAYSLV